MRINKKVDLTKGKFFLPKGISRRERVFKNNAEVGKKIIYRRIVVTGMPYLRIDFKGREGLNSRGIELRLISMDRKWISEPVEINAVTLIKLREEVKTKRYLMYIKIPAKAEMMIERLEIMPWKKYSIIDKGDFTNEVLIITPMYPSINNPYSATFVYSKVKKYLENGIKADVAVATNNENKLYKYQFKGSQINKVSFDDLRNIIQNGKYNKILVHFLDRQIGNALLACDLDDKEILVYCHGADVDLWNPNIFSEYFVPDYVFTKEENAFREDRLAVLKTFEAMSNVRWIFNTKWNYENSKKVTGLSFKDYEIIPCVIDENEFAFEKRDDSLKTRILVLKRMDNIRQYAVDLAVRIIMRLSREDFFDSLHFTLVGAGEYQNELMHPLRDYKNVNIIDRFYDHDEINNAFHENGILLAPSRYDTQGVTVGEAAMSGMVVVASTGTGVSDMLSEKLGTFFDNDNLEDAVKIISDIVKNRRNFGELSESFHDAIIKTASQETIDKEIRIIKQKTVELNRLTNNKLVRAKKKPVLSIAIPAYNAGQYLENNIKALVNHNKIDLLEIIVVNDGSTDDTVQVMKSILKNASPSVKNAIVFIDKENGGHGSTINAALKIARGKYFRIVDADDRLDSKALEHHLEFLNNTDADIVFTNTIHDLSIESVFKEDHKYDFMQPYLIYPFDELCEEYYGFGGYGPVLSTTSTKTQNLRDVGCKLTEKSFYVDIEYNYYMTEASDTAALDPVELYYYYLGRDGQSLSMESYKRNFSHHLRILESVIKLLEKDKLTKNKYEHFVRVQLHETVFHQYRIALEMFDSYKKFKQVEKVLKKYPRYYNDRYLAPNYVQRMRRFGFPYYLLRKIMKKVRPAVGSIRRLVR